jgi:uncharacterized membrane protein
MSEPKAAGGSRFNSLDAWRGVIMVIMALDHVRDFIHAGAMTGSPEDLATTTPALFFTRWLTHFWFRSSGRRSIRRRCSFS